MRVPLQLTLGVILAIFIRAQAKSLHHSRSTRDTVFPLQLSNQNGTEKINNRDLNKIKIDLPKTDDNLGVNSKDNSFENSNSNNNNNVRNKNTENNTAINNKDNKSDSERYTNKISPKNTAADNKKDDEVLTTKNNETYFKEKQDKDEKTRKKSEVEKEIDRLESGRSIDSDSSKFWSSDFHNKNNVFTLLSNGDNQKFFHEDEDEEALIDHNFPSTTFSVYPEIHEDLTTPRSPFFDKKFKEAQDSIEQNLDTEDEDAIISDNGDTDDNISEFNPEEFMKNRKNGTMEFVKMKSIRNNENIGKNSKHKDVDVEETKIMSYEKVFNDTTSYDSSLEQPKSSTTSTFTPKLKHLPSGTTNKNLESAEINKDSSYISSNKIETETTKTVTLRPLLPTTNTKDLDTNIHLLKNIDLASTTPKNDFLEPIEHNIIPLQLSDLDKDQKGSFSDSKLSVTRFTEPPVQKTTSSLLENHSERSSVVDVSTENGKKDDNNILTKGPSTEKLKIFTKDNKQILSSTEQINNGIKDFISEISVDYNTSTKSSVTTPKLTTVSSFIEKEETTTSATETPTSYEVLVEIKENSKTEATTENIFFTTNETTTADIFTQNDETSTVISTEKTSRKVKFEDITTIKENIISKTEEDVPSKTTSDFLTTTTENIFEKTTILNITEQEANIVESREMTTVENHETTLLENIFNIFKDKDETTVKSETTTSKSVTATAEITTIEDTTFQGDKIDKPNATTTTKTTYVPQQNEVTTLEPEQSTPVNLVTKNQDTTVAEQVTTEFNFVHIKNENKVQTTLIPEIPGPNLNYSSFNSSTEEPQVNQNLHKAVIDAMNATENVMNTTLTDLSTEHLETTSDQSISPSEELTNDGPNKSTIAAIAISCVAAVCLVLLGILLYVMRKRQKRFKGVSRCKPVSLDDYSIDNLSVYNSVRRKGKDRMSKRSFGNPAFEDSSVSHPLNFPALSKFSTNLEDINAEFEDVPQIHAKTSELPEGCDSKNRYANVIPLPETRVLLKNVEGVPNSDYINANYVTGPKNSRGYYIATQGPMENTVDDFWRMIWEQNAKVVLMMTHLVENGLEKCVDYLPESEVVNTHRIFGDFQVTLKKREVKDKYIISSLQLKNMVSNSWRELTHFWYLGWPEKGVPNEANSLIAFLIEARSYMKTATIDKKNEFESSQSMQNGGPSTEKNPVVVHCSPGTGRTGVVIACDIAIREFETTRLVDIPKIVYRIRRDRANSVQSKEQYQFIYKVVSLYAIKLTGGQFLKE